MSLETILTDVKEHVLTIRLNRPNVLNAANDNMGFELQHALQDAETDSQVRCLVLTGVGRGFCAGEDVSGFKARDFKGLGDLLRKKYHPIILGLRRLRKPVIAGLNGIAAGGGASMALACDIRIASELASFKMAFIGMGLVPDAGSTYFLTRLIGSGRALELAMTGRTVSAEEALAMGIVSRVVPPAKLESAIQELARQLAKGPRTALELTKELMDEVAGMRLAEALEREAQTQQVASETREHREAAEAFLEKREPRF